MSLREEVMQPCGLITTIMDLRKVKEWWFNIPLLVFQLVFMVIGKIYGKVEVKWGQMWQAAKVSHVRLCLKKRIGDKSLPPATTWPAVHDTYEYISFGWPKAEIEKYWHMGIINRDKRFKYYDPTLEPSDEFIAAMIEYAESEVGKRYDWLQLILGYPANFIVWLFCPWLWGKEVIHWFNLPGGKEVCSSGWVACLRWGEKDDCPICRKNHRMVCTNYFKGYDTAVIPPCLAPLSKNWIIKHREEK